MSKSKAKESVPKLENLGKITAATIFVPLLSSLAIYGVNVAFHVAEPPKADSAQSQQLEAKAKTASNRNESAK